MNRMEAVRLIVEHLHSDDWLIHANGAISRESYFCNDRFKNFYMLGSMGLAPSIAMGLALHHPEQRILILDGDGNVLMGLGNLALIGALHPAHLIHIVFDNGVYGTTGGQPTLSGQVQIWEIAQGCGYRICRRVDGMAVVPAFQEMIETPGPHFLQIVVSEDVPFAPPRIPFAAHQIKERFMEGIRF